jgi:hypothetical protein
MTQTNVGWQIMHNMSPVLQQFNMLAMPWVQVGLLLLLLKVLCWLLLHACKSVCEALLKLCI